MTEAQKEDYAKQVLESPHLFFELVQILNRAGMAAIQKKVYIDNSHSICVLPKGIPNLTRRVVPLSLTVQPDRLPTVDFDYRSITIVGGAAVKLYEMANSKTNTVHTADIDAIWWPKVHLPPNFKDQLKSAKLVDTTTPEFIYLTQSRNRNPNNNTPTVKEPYRYAYGYGTGKDRINIHAEAICPLLDAAEHVVVSSSPAIQSLIIEFTSQLNTHLNMFVAEHNDILRTFVNDIFRIDNAFLSASAKYENMFQYGIANVWGYITIHKSNGEKVAAVKILEMTIHDDASSQPSTTIEHAEQDIVYSLFSDKPTLYNPVQVMYSNVPTVRRLLDQQLYVFEHRKDAKKNETTLRRIKLLYDMLPTNEMKEYKNVFEKICSKKEYEFLCKPSFQLLEPAYATMTPVATMAPVAPMTMSPTPYSVNPYAGYGAPTPYTYTYPYVPTPIYTPAPYMTPTYAPAYPYGMPVYTPGYSMPTAHTRPSFEFPKDRSRTIERYAGRGPNGRNIYEIIDKKSRKIIQAYYKGGNHTRKRTTRSRKTRKNI